MVYISIIEKKYSGYDEDKYLYKVCSDVSTPCQSPPITSIQNILKTLQSRSLTFT